MTMGPEPESGPAPTGERLAVEALVAASQGWMRKALNAWHSDDWPGVCLMAPQAIELLAKASLWQENPALLAPMSEQGERTLVRLVSGVPLTAKGMRTIGLGAALGRLEMLDSAFPISRDRWKHISDVRNGAVHVGAGEEEPRALLVDCLDVSDYLLGRLKLARLAYYGAEMLDTADALLIRHQESVMATVSLKRARARHGLSELEHRMGREEFTELVSRREEQRHALPTGDYVTGGTGVDEDCPECGSTGRLLGDPSIDIDVDMEAVRIGYDEWDWVANPYFQASLDPSVFVCSVCHLVLNGRDELEQAGLPARPFDVERAQLDDPAFSYDALVDAYGG